MIENTKPIPEENTVEYIKQASDNLHREAILDTIDEIMARLEKLEGILVNHNIQPERSIGPIKYC